MSIAIAMVVMSGAFHSTANAQPVQIVALGDSLMAGYLLPADAAFPNVLERRLRASGLDVEVTNAGVSGDTSSGGLARVDWAVPDGTDIVVLGLGANDMLRGLDPAITKASLEKIMTRLREKKVRVVLAGMLAAPSMGRDYETRFNAIYPDLAKQFNAPLYRYFLDGVTGVSGTRLLDGMHPNRRGVEIMVEGIAPAVERVVKATRGR